MKSVCRRCSAASRHLLAGTTAIIDHFPEQGFGERDVEAVVDAYRMAGLRAMVALRISTRPTPTSSRWAAIRQAFAVENPLSPVPLADTMALVMQCITRFDHEANGRIRVCPAPSNPMRCSDNLLADVVRIAQRYDTPVHMHLLESAIQASIAKKRYGRSMVAHLDRMGVSQRPAFDSAHYLARR